jgi:hypothetical protein
MSFVCYKCNIDIVFEENEQLGSKVELLHIRDQIMQDLKKHNLDANYNPDKHVLCIDCFDGEICSVIEKKCFKLEDDISKIDATMKLFEGDVEKIQRLIKSNKVDTEMEETIKTQLMKLEEEEDRQKKDLQDLTNKQLEYEAKEAKFWDSVIEFQNNLFHLQEKTNYVEHQTKYLQTQLERTQKINVLSDVFNISAEYEVGTINNLKVGRLLNSPGINWDETSAALGQVILLISILEHRCKFENKKVRMKPFGSFSQVARLHEDGREECFEMYGPPKDETKFNRAHELLLESQRLLHENLNDKFAKMPGGITYDLPHKIWADQIEGRPFKYISNRLEKWTEVCKYFLTNCKYLIYLAVIYEKNARMNLSQVKSNPTSPTLKPANSNNNSILDSYSPEIKPAVPK